GNFFPPNVYFTSRVNPKWAWGVGLNAPFGLGVEWDDPNTFTGRTIVTKADLHALNGSASLAFAPNDKWSFAAGPSVLFADVELNNIQTIPSTGGAPVNVSHVKLESDFTPGYGFHVAGLATPSAQWRIGVTYRS